MTPSVVGNDVKYWMQFGEFVNATKLSKTYALAFVTTFFVAAVYIYYLCSQSRPLTGNQTTIHPPQPQTHLICCFKRFEGAHTDEMFK